MKDTKGINNFIISGSAVDATGTNGYELNASDLGSLSVKGNNSVGMELLQIAAYDGKDWGPISKPIPPMVDVVGPMLTKAAAEYIADKPGWKSQKCN